MGTEQRHTEQENTERPAPEHSTEQSWIQAPGPLNSLGSVLIRRARAKVLP